MKSYYISVMVVMAFCATPVRAFTLAWAPATSTTGVDNVNEPATWETRGHGAYTKAGPLGPPAPPGTFTYAFNTHTTAACGNPYCTASEFYYRVKALSGIGEDVDGESLTVRFDQRIYAGTGTYFSGWQAWTSVTLFADGEVREDTWWGGVSGLGTTQAVTYKVGAWQGSADWVPTTTTPAF